MNSFVSQKRATWFALAAVLCWSTVATAFKISLQSFSPMLLIFVASVVAFLFLCALLGYRNQLGALWRQPAGVYLQSFGLGMLNPVLYYIVLFHAYDQLPAQEAQALNYSWAIVLSLLAVPMLGHKLGKFDIVAAVICYVGVLVIATRGNLLALEFGDAYGVALALATTVIWPIYWILNRKDQREPILGLTLNFLSAIPVLACLVLLTDDISMLFDLSVTAWSAGIYVGIVELGLGFVFWMMAMKSATNTSRIANLIFLSPFLSLILISRILGEPIIASTLIGLALIVVGLLLQQRFGEQIG